MVSKGLLNIGHRHWKKFVLALGYPWRSGASVLASTRPSSVYERYLGVESFPQRQEGCSKATRSAGGHCACSVIKVRSKFCAAAACKPVEHLVISSDFRSLPIAVNGRGLWLSGNLERFRRAKMGKRLALGAVTKNGGSTGGGCLSDAKLKKAHKTAETILVIDLEPDVTVGEV
eukprot:IDg8304t1